MKRTLKTYIFCLDDHKGFSEDVKKRFSDTSRYIVNIAHNRDEFFRQLDGEKDRKPCRVAIIGFHDTNESIELTRKLVSEIKSNDRRAGVIIIHPPEKTEEIKRTLSYSADSFIPRNNNTILRIHNNVKKLISEHNLQLYRRRRNLSFYILISLVILAAIFTLITWLRQPVYF